MKRNDFGFKSDKCVYPAQLSPELGYLAVQVLLKEELDEYFRWATKDEMLFESESTVNYFCIKYPQFFGPNNETSKK